MEDLLQQAGLNEPQAKVYLYLLANGEVAPPAVANVLSLTRSNAYKVLEKLLEMRLVSRAESAGKFIYKAEDPIALAGLVAAEQTRVRLLEQNITAALQQLREQFRRSSDIVSLQSYSGQPAIDSLRHEQAASGETIYVIADKSAAWQSQPGPNVKLNAASSYTSPVEWTVSGDELLIISFEHDASAIRIKNPTVARAFKELWHLLDTSLRQAPGYKKLPKQARGKV